MKLRSKRKFNLKFLLAILLALTMFSSSLTTVVYASPEGNGSDVSYGRGGKNKVQGGVSEAKSGYLCYVTDNNGGIASDVVYIPYGSGASYNKDFMYARYTNTPSNRTYSGNMASATNGGFTRPPFTFSGGVYGGSLKKWMITKGADDKYGVVKFLDNVFSMDKDTFIDGELVLNVEAVAISRISPTNTTQVAYTAYTIAKLRKAGISDPQLNSFWQGRFQRCGMLEKSWGGLIVGSDMASNTSPYGVIQVRAKDLLPEDPVPDEPIEEEADDYIKANEINGQFTDLLADGADMRKYNQYEASLNGGDEDFWKVKTGTHIRDERLKGGTWKILEEINSSILDFYEFANGHVLRCAPADHETYKTYDEEKIFDEDSGDVYPGYAYQYSRSMFGEDLVICDYRALVEGYAGLENYLTDTLKMSYGHDKSNGKTIGVGKEGNIGESKTDTYSFKAYSVEKYEEDEGHEENIWVDDDSYEDGGYYSDETETVYEWDDDDVVEKEEEVTSEAIEYEVSHTLYKYSPKNIDTAELSSAGTLVYSNSSGEVASRVAWATMLPNIMQVVPEVAYRFYKPELTDTISSSDKMDGREGMKMYAMGEKIRSCLPAALHGYYVRIPGGSISGNVLLDSPTTGTNAKELADNWGTTSKNMPYQVTKQGSGYSMITENAPIIEFASVNLNFYDGEVGNINPNSEFGDMGGQASHESFVDNIANNLVTLVEQKRFKSKNGSSQLGQTYVMTHTENENKLEHHAPEHYWLRFENGAINGDDKNAVINAIADAYNIDASAASSLFSSWNLEGELQSMFETSSITNAGGVKNSPNKWYDEQSIVLGVTVYKTTLKWGVLYLDDKADYGDSVDNDAYNILNSGRNGVEAKFYYSLFYSPDTNNIDIDDSSFNINPVRYLVKNQFIKGSEFLINNDTTTSH